MTQLVVLVLSVLAAPIFNILLYQPRYIVLEFLKRVSQACIHNRS